MENRSNGIAYVYNKQDESAVRFTINHLKETLLKSFTPESVQHFLGSDNDSELTDENLPAVVSDNKEMEVEQNNEDDKWGMYSSKQFRNVTARVVVRETNQAMSLLE